jgi:hypothetical protein
VHSGFVLPPATLHFRIELMLVAVLRFLAIPVGILSFYTAFFMYEDEEGEWQNRIEKLWVAINDEAKIAGSPTSAFFNKVSVVVTRGFDRIFGSRLFSLQSVGVSTSYSLAGFVLSGCLAFAILLRTNNPLNDPLPEELLKHGALLEFVFLIAGLIFFILALLPSLSPTRWFVALSLLPAFFWTIGLPIELAQSNSSSHKQKYVAFFTALLVSFFSDIFLLALVRFTIRWVSAKTSVSRIALAVLTQASVFVLLILVPWDIGLGLIETVGPRPEFVALLCVALLNVFTGITSCMFLFSLLFVLLHKIFWPILSRLVYPLARHQIIRNRKVMVAVATACFIFAFPLMPAAIKSILQWLAE